MCNSVSHEVQYVRDPALHPLPNLAPALGSAHFERSGPAPGAGTDRELPWQQMLLQPRATESCCGQAWGGELYIQTGDVGEGSHISGTGINGVL